MSDICALKNVKVDQDQAKHIFSAFLICQLRCFKFLDIIKCFLKDFRPYLN